ncbi:MAG TPA: hypothetical protein VH598_09770 [Verrucomicrobiae bacterium]|nr:hypothetical protein [Verrucomicrobiae bacterium]
MAGFLNGFFRQPGAHVQIPFDFSALVAVFLGFFWMTVGFSEGMFAVTYGFGDCIQRFCHIKLSFLLNSTEALTMPT